MGGHRWWWVGTEDSFHWDRTMEQCINSFCLVSQQRCQLRGIVFSPLAAWPCLTEQWLLISQACVCVLLGEVSGIRLQPASLPGCLYAINEVEEGEEDGRKVLWRRGVPARAFSMTLKSSLSYMLQPRFLCLPCPPCTLLPPSVSAS